MKTSLAQIEDKLISLAEEEETLYPAFYIALNQYELARAQILMSNEIAGLGAQPQRDAECLRMMAQKKITKEYQKLAAKQHTHDIQYKIWMQLARLYNSKNFNQ